MVCNAPWHVVCWRGACSQPAAVGGGAARAGSPHQPDSAPSPGEPDMQGCHACSACYKAWVLSLHAWKGQCTDFINFAAPTDLVLAPAAQGQDGSSRRICRRRLAGIWASLSGGGFRARLSRAAGSGARGGLGTAQCAAAAGARCAAAQPARLADGCAGVRGAADERGCAACVRAQRLAGRPGQRSARHTRSPARCGPPGTPPFPPLLRYLADSEPVRQTLSPCDVLCDLAGKGRHAGGA